MDKVVHFEIPADDLNRAKKFYKSIFGWELNDIPDMEYTIIHTVPVDDQNMPLESGGINGGMMKRTAKGEGPVVVILVSSVDEYIAKIIKAGGTVVMPKQEIMKMGLYARVKDTEGNVIGIFEAIMK